MTLYDIDRALTELVDPDTGELLDYDAFAALGMEREKKIEGMALWVKDLDAEAKAIKEEAAALKIRQKAAESKVERLKNYLDQALDGEKFATPRCAVSFRRTSALEVEDAAALIAWAEGNGYGNCIRHVEPEISKTAVTALLKSGVKVPFVRVAAGRSVGVK